MSASGVLGVIVVVAAGILIGAGLVTGGAASPLVYYSEGFGPPEADVAINGTAHWVQGDRAVVGISLSRDAPDAIMRVAIQSFHRPRTVTVSIDGRRLRSEPVPADVYRAITFRLGALPRGDHAVELVARPGARSIAAVLGTDDPRSVSLRVAEPIVVSTGG